MESDLENESKDVYKVNTESSPSSEKPDLRFSINRISSLSQDFLPSPKNLEDFKPFSSPIPNNLKRYTSSTPTKMDRFNIREDAIISRLNSLKEIDLNDFNQIEFYIAAGINLTTLTKVFHHLISLYYTKQLQISTSLLRVVRLGVSSKSHGPNRVFYYNKLGDSLLDGGIEMTGMTSFSKSFPHSFGISCWLWISLEACPFTLCSFRSKEHYGISITVIPSESKLTLLIDTRDERKRDGIQIGITQQNLFRTWHFIHIAHFKSTSTIVITINDSVVIEKSLHFPTLGMTGQLSESRVMENFEGFTGSISILSGINQSSTLLAKKQLSIVNADGEESTTSEFTEYFAVYSPECVSDGDVCFDVYGSHLGRLRNNVKPWVLLPSRDLLRSVGGPQMILPFFNSIDEDEQPQQQAELCLQAVLLLASFLEGHVPNQNDFYYSQGPSLLKSALEHLPTQVKSYMCKESGKDLLSAYSSLVHACGLETAINITSSTAEIGGARLAKSGKIKLTELELDRILTFQLDFWLLFYKTSEDGQTIKSWMNRVVSLCAQRVIWHSPQALRKRFGLQFFLDKLKEMYDKCPSLDSKRFISKSSNHYIDTVLLPLFSDINSPITKEEIRNIIDCAVGSGYRKPGDFFSRNFTWSDATLLLSHDALRLLIKIYTTQPHNHAILNSFQIPNILAVELISFSGIGEQLRALALRVIGLCIATSPESNYEIMFSYISSALSYSSNRFESSPPPKETSSPPPTTRSYSSFASPLPPPILTSKFMTSAEAVAKASQSPLGSLIHISHAIYNSLLSIAITSKETHSWKKACDSSLCDDIDEEEEVSTISVIVDDALQIVRFESINVILNVLPHTTLLIQQRIFQDLFVLLKLDSSNRKQFCIQIPNWQFLLGDFFSTSRDIGIVEMGIKIWIILLQDYLEKGNGEVLLETFFSSEIIGNFSFVQNVLQSLLQSQLYQQVSTPVPFSLECIVKVAHLSKLHSNLFDLLDNWSLINVKNPICFTILIKEGILLMIKHLNDLNLAGLAIKRVLNILVCSPPRNEQITDAVVFTVSRLHYACTEIR
jgi:hypothetical protein